ncbi:hypothetical protein [Rhodobacter sp. SY28-1]|uniref:hypothetical protein n=1 Tax=Rhodobacter sp. SY28-1 TaxID=2562317 RepID=UPI0010C0206B|nr:hypothetical protein [Rhodobacter sp. SY28-1]
MFRGSFAVVICVIAALIGVGFAALRYQVLDAYLPTAVLTAMDRARGGAPATGEITPKRETVASVQEGPGRFLSDGPEGLRAEGPIAAIAGNRPILIEDVIAGYAPSADAGVPATVMAIRPISGCRLTPPSKGTSVGHVTAGESTLNLPLTTYGDGDLARGVQDFVDAMRAGAADPGANLRGPNYEAYDVAVTETREPVYLVLESRTGNRIWNIHAAEGARIERVILLGGGQAGVANLDPVVPVEVILQDGLAGCGISPAYPLSPGQETAAAATGEELTPAELADAVRAYDNWFRDSFGVLSSETRAGFDVGTISVVGPVPRDAAARPEYAPIQEATLRTTRGAYFEIAGQVAKGEDFASRVRAIATTFAFGDLGYLRQGAEF